VGEIGRVTFATKVCCCLTPPVQLRSASEPSALHLNLVPGPPAHNQTLGGEGRRPRRPRNRATDGVRSDGANRMGAAPRGALPNDLVAISIFRGACPQRPTTDFGPVRCYRRGSFTDTHSATRCPWPACLAKPERRRPTALVETAASR
jgi:hypothetical protein